MNDLFLIVVNVFKFWNIFVFVIVIVWIYYEEIIIYFDGFFCFGVFGLNDLV